MAGLRVDEAVLLRALEAAFQKAQDGLVKKWTEEVETTKWRWPRPPSPRDIVDTGTLRDSLNNPSFSGPRVPKVIRRGNLIKARHVWYAPYAVYVHEGYTLRTGFSGPPRPWITTGVKNFDWGDALRRGIRMFGPGFT